MANVGAFCMAGVPILGLPNTITVRGRISSPNFDAAAAWSNSVKTTHPFAVTAASKRLIVSWTEYLLGLVIRPDSAGNDIFGTDTSKMARPRPKRPFRRVMEAPPIGCDLLKVAVAVLGAAAVDDVVPYPPVVHLQQAARQD